MKLKNIKVTAQPGRVARVSPNGRYIPHDNPIVVPLTPYIERLLNHFGDIVEHDPERPPPRSIKPKPGKPAKDDPPPPAPVATETTI